MSKKLVVVTGAARGIGLATTRKFLAEGWQVAMLDIDAVTLSAAIAGLGVPSDTLAVECDVSDPDQVAAGVAKVAANFGRIDALVNNAGIADFRTIADTDFEMWSRIMAVNLNGPFICTKACTPLLLKRGGAV